MNEAGVMPAGCIYKLWKRIRNFSSQGAPVNIRYLMELFTFFFVINIIKYLE